MRSGEPEEEQRSPSIRLRPILLLCSLLVAMVSLTACANLLNGITSQDGITVREGIRYAAGSRGTYDLYIPNGAGADTPIVVFFYGGSWDSGDKDDYLFVGQSLAAAGLIAAVPDYRLYPEVTFPGFVEDGAEAIASIIDAARNGRAGLPPGERPIFLMGHSAGAQIAALLNYDERYLRSAGLPASAISGFVGLAGPYDFLPLTSDRYRRIFPAGTRASSQPVRFVDGSEPPALLISGENDTTVNPRNSRSLAQKVEQAGGRVELRLYPDVGHIGAIVALSTALTADGAIRGAVLDFIRSE